MFRRTSLQSSLLSLAALCAAFSVAPQIAQGQTQQARARVRVLFIGNSFTYTNNLPEMLRAIGHTSARPVEFETEMVAEGAATLAHTWNQGVARRRLHAAHWDYVVLQEQSSLGSLILDGHAEVNDPAKLFYPGVRLFDDEIRRIGAKTVLMLTWAPRSEPELQDALTYAYMNAGRAHHAAVAPVGLAWQKARRVRPQLDLFDPAPWDGLHPSAAGSYLAAAVLYAEIVGRSPVGATAEIRGHPTPDGQIDTSQTVALASLDTSDAQWLQKLAWSSYTAIRDSGGYVSRTAPRRLQPPTIPSGLPLGESGLVGHWWGYLDLYYQSPAHIELDIAKGDAGLSGNLRILPERSGSAELFPLSAIRIVDGTLSFTVRNKKYEHGIVTYEGALTARGLEGIARFSNDTLGAMSVGSWALTDSTRTVGQGAPAPPGRMVDIGGQRIHVNCTGTGSPTVLLESGTGDVSVIWTLVQPQVSAFTRVCSYDRGGYAWSDPGTRPRTFPQLALELHTALDRLGVTGPYVLVGQSYGGLVIRGFAAQYRREVTGMVMVDAVHEDQRVVYGGQPHRIRDGATGRVAPSPRIALDTSLLEQARGKAIRPMATTLESPFDHLPAYAQDVWRWAQTQPLLSLAQQAETDWSPEELQRMHDERLRDRVSLGELPLIVLARPHGGYDDGMAISADSLEHERRNLQADLARLSHRGTLIFAEHSGHNIHLDNPGLVIESIRSIVATARAPR